MDHPEHTAAAVAGIGAFATTVAGAGLDTPVPTCPGWALRDLVRHAGLIQRWAAAIVTQRATERISPRSLDMAFPEPDGDWAGWLAAGAPIVADALGGADGDAPVWAWGPDQHVRFWSRRLLHETAVHHADACLALGREPAIDTGTAIDGVDELLENLPAAAEWSAGVRELRGSGETLHLHATDAEGEWMIRRVPAGFEWEHGHGKGDVALRGAAADLLLALYGRRGLDEPGRFEIFGDRSLLEHWIAHSAL